MSLQEMDFPSLLAWRRTSVRAYEEVESYLTDSLHRILGKYVQPIHPFILGMTEHRVLCTREAALAFFLHDNSLLTPTLELTVGRTYAQNFEQFLLNTEPLGIEFLWEEEHGSGDFETIFRVFRTSLSQYIRLACSPSDSALTPITRSSNTAFITYVSPISFGCAYAYLTLRRLALLGPPASEPDQDRHDRLEKRGFRFEALPCSLLDESFPEHDAYSDLPYPCLRHLYTCPDQARYFGDRGSLLDFFDIAHISLGALAQEEHAPFAPAAVWNFRRYWSGCWNDCSYDGPMVTVWRSTKEEMALPGPIYFGSRFVGLERLYALEQHVSMLHG